MKKQLPKYQYIYNDLKNKIMDGVYPINSKIEDGNSLCVKYGVSLMTVKKSLDLLVSEGFVTRRRGDGTFVKDWTKGEKTKMYAIEGATRRHNSPVESEVIYFEIEHPSQEIADKLSINQNDFVYHIIRLRVINKVKSIIEYTYMPVSMFPGINKEHLNNSIYDYIINDLKLVIQSSFISIKGVHPSELERETMELNNSDFLIEVEQIANLDDGRIFEYSIARHIPEEFNFKTIIFNT
jgi:DNA-binding GntR family transcriptional regulator